MKSKAINKYMKERNWDLGLMTKKKEPAQFHDENMLRYDSNFDKKIIDALDRKNKLSGRTFV